MSFTGLHQKGFLIFAVLVILSVSVLFDMFDDLAVYATTGAESSGSPNGLSGGGGGCSNCIPPTIGLSKNGNDRHVSDGFSVNGVGIDVEHFYQKDCSTNYFSQ